MLKRVRRNYVKALLPFITAFVLLCALMLILSDFGFLYFFREPVDVDSITLEELDGAYAEIDINKIEGTAWYGSETEDGKAIVYEIYCIYIIDEDMYLAVRIPGRHQGKIQAMYDAFESLGEEKAREINFGSFTGTVNRRGDDEKLDSFLRDWVMDTVFSEISSIADPYTVKEEGMTPEQEAYFNEHALPYVLEIDTIGSGDITAVYIMTFAAAAFLLVSLILTLTMFTGIWDRSVRKLVAAEGAEAVEKDYTAGKTICDAMHIGHENIWWFKKAKTELIKTADIIWAYPRSRRLEGGKLRWLIVLKTEDKREYCIVLGDKEKVLSAMEAIAAEGYLVTTGFDKKKQQLYDKDMSSFKSYIKKEKTEREEAKEELRPGNDLDETAE